MEAIFKIEESELNYAFLKKIKSFFKGRTIEIGIKDLETSSHVQESEAQYFAKIDAAIERIEKGEGIVFSADEFDEMVENYSNKIKNGKNLNISSQPH